MREYKHDLEALLGLEFFGMKLGLTRMTELLSAMGDPHTSFRSIHVAGTNGKGSVCATIASILDSEGYKSGLFTSPHLVNLRERIRVDREMISEQAVQEFCIKYWDTIKEFDATFFEVMTAMAFDHFRNTGVEIAVIETGLGGRLDATNVLEAPIATLITSIGLDHIAQLGETYAAIAYEKAGIFKPGVPAYVNCRDSLREVFTNRAQEVGAPLTFLQEASNEPYASYQPAYIGKHQRENLDLALLTLDSVGLLLGVPATIQSGIDAAPALIRGRLETMNLKVGGESIEMVTDVGHNPEAIEAIVSALRETGKSYVTVLGLMQDKEVEATLSALREISNILVATEAKWKRAMPASELANFARKFFEQVELEPDVVKAVELAVRLTKQSASNAILFIGSHYTLGEYLANQAMAQGVVAESS